IGKEEAPRIVMILDALNRLGTDMGDELPEIEPYPTSDGSHITDGRMLDVAIKVTDTRFPTRRLGRIHDDVLGIAKGDAELKTNATHVWHFLNFQLRQGEADGAVMHIKGASFNRHIMRFDHRQVLVGVHNCTRGVIEIAFKIDVNPATKFESLKEIDLGNLAEILRRGLRI